MFRQQVWIDLDSTIRFLQRKSCRRHKWYYCLWSGFWRQQHFLLRKKPGAPVLPLAKAMNFIEFLSIKLKESVKIVVEIALRDKICYGVVGCCSFSCTSAAVRPRLNTGQIAEVGLGWKECTGNTQTHQHTRLRSILMIPFIAMRTFLETPTNVWRPCEMARLFGIASESVDCNLGLDAPRCASHPYLSKSSQFWNPESRSKGLNVIKAQHKVRISRVNQLHCFPVQQVQFSGQQLMTRFWWTRHLGGGVNSSFRMFQATVYAHCRPVRIRTMYRHKHQLEFNRRSDVDHEGGDLTAGRVLSDALMWRDSLITDISDISLIRIRLNDSLVCFFCCNVHIIVSYWMLLNNREMLIIFSDFQWCAHRSRRSWGVARNVWYTQRSAATCSIHCMYVFIFFWTATVWSANKWTLANLASSTIVSQTGRSRTNLSFCWSSFQ